MCVNQKSILIDHKVMEQPRLGQYKDIESTLRCFENYFTKFSQKFLAKE